MLSHQGPQLSTKNTATFLLSTIIGGEKEEGNTCESIYQENKTSVNNLRSDRSSSRDHIAASSSSLLQNKFLNS